jgi:large subunit ribosomal protein L4e
MDRTTANIYNTKGETCGTIEKPKIFATPIRADLIHHIFTNVSKNSMQPYGTKDGAGHHATAESWGTGRAKARVPRVNGSGSNRNGQGAYANFCRGGHRFGTVSLMKRWYRPVPQQQLNYAIASAIAASQVPSFVAQRGHQFDKAKEIPIVVSNDLESTNKTRDAVAFMKAAGIYDDVQRVIEGKIHRSTKGKYRRSAFRTKKGPLVLYNNDNGIVKAFRNIPGVDVVHVSKIELKHVAPGSQIGRLIVWTQSAFELIDAIFKNVKKFKVPQPMMKNTDIERIITSDEIQSVLRPKLATVQIPRERDFKLLSVTNDEWSNAFKKIAELREEEKRKRESPEAIRALFELVNKQAPPTPTNISVQIIDHKLE